MTLSSDEIGQLKFLCYQKETYPLNEVKEYLYQMANPKVVDQIISNAEIQGQKLGVKLKLKKEISAADVFKLVYICLEMTQDITLQNDERRSIWMIMELEKKYL